MQRVQNGFHMSIALHVLVAVYRLENKMDWLGAWVVVGWISSNINITLWRNAIRKIALFPLSCFRLLESIPVYYGYALKIKRWWGLQIQLRVTNITLCMFEFSPARRFCVYNFERWTLLSNPHNSTEKNR